MANFTFRSAQAVMPASKKKRFAPQFWKWTRTAVIKEFSPAGLRNAVGLKYIGNFLWATNQGADHLGLNKPDETFYALKNNADYGWASCYQSNGKVYRDTKYNRLKSCRNVPRSYAYFPAHSSALGFDYFDDAGADESIKNAFLVSLHGSTDKDIGSGYKIVMMRKGEKLQDFISGFLQGKTVRRSPVRHFETLGKFVSFH